MPGPVPLSDSGESDNYDPSYAVQLSDSPESDNRLHTMGNGTSFFSSRYVSATHAYASRGPNIDSQRFTACTARPASSRKTLALTSTVIHPRIYPLDGAR
ncbi:hypothetical protein F6S84_00270 [Bifidobacterium dentium]|nr:hypothetical protein [Bifidobacterium dentium]NEG53351.1 hypothetical protein [Bifidobacterium dentium]